jgi:hypothetical protein
MHGSILMTFSIVLTFTFRPFCSSNVDSMVSNLLNCLVGSTTHCTKFEIKPHLMTLFSCSLKCGFYLRQEYNLFGLATSLYLLVNIRLS